MGATTPTLVLQGVSGAIYTYSLYFAGGDAAGYIVPISQYLAATSTSPKDFVLPEPCTIKYLSGPATGVLRVLADGVATGLLLNTAVIIAQAANANAVWGQLAGVRSDGVTAKRYSFVVEVAMAA